MIIAEKLFSNNINSPVRDVKAKVELFNSSTLVSTFKDTDKLKSFTVERVGEDSKFFGFGFCQKVNVKLIDMNRQLNITTANHLKIYLGFEGKYLNPYPDFQVSEVRRDENTNELSITAYDRIYKAAGLKVAELGLIPPYSLKTFAEKCGTILGASGCSVSGDQFNLVYESGANFDGLETIREALDDLAEATQTIYYINSMNVLMFKPLTKTGAAVETISKDKYFTLHSGDNRRLKEICHATELGDNVSAAIEATGSTQYVRDNAFWTMREDIGTLVNNALTAVGGLTINQFSCSWRGNFLIEPGDKIALTTKDGKTVYSFLLDDVAAYDGTYSQKTQWKYQSDNAETASNPSSLGDALNQTFARVDKVNQKIELVSKQNDDKISKIEQDANSINASISRIEKQSKENAEATNAEIQTLKSQVSAQMTADEVKIEIQKELDNGIDKVETSRGFTFNDDGLKVSKSNSEMETLITEDGMRISRSGSEVLVANNNGVDAENLHATTYLIIGKNSRFEDYGNNLTGCFWIG